MDFLSVNNMPPLARVPTARDTAKRIIQYGADNLYPIRSRNVMQLSPIAKSSVKLMSAFIRGDGWEKNGDKVLDEITGSTANDILRSISEDKSLYDGYCLHLNSSIIGSVKQVQHIPFEYCRFGLPDQKGRIKFVEISNNWETIDETLPNDVEDSVRYQLFDAEQNGREALLTNKGMVLYSTPRKNTYPLSTIDAILETCQADHELAVYELGSITNGFLGLSIVKWPNNGDSEEERFAVQKKFEGLKGSGNGNSIIVAMIDEDYEGGDLIEQVPAINGNDLFVNMTANIKSRIIQNFALPSSLLGMLPEGSIFSAQQIRDDFFYMSARTKDIRLEIEQQFEKFGLGLGAIIPRQFNVTEELSTDAIEPRQTTDSQDRPI